MLTAGYNAGQLVSGNLPLTHVLHRIAVTR